jgi:hypothetical protein
MWHGAHSCALVERSPETNIAMQRADANAARTRRGLPIRLTIFSDRTGPSRLRFFPGADVLRFFSSVAPHQTKFVSQ